MSLPGFADARCLRHTASGETIAHGTHCECVQLAAALGLRPSAIPYFYCKNFLQRRWTMACRHGEVAPREPEISGPEKWKDKGQMNPVMAILVSNG